MDILHIVVAETLGTDGEYYTEVYPCRNDKDADDTMNSLIVDMAETMHINIPSEDICITKELKGDNWWFRVSDTVHENFL